MTAAKEILNSTELNRLRVARPPAEEWPRNGSDSPIFNLVTRSESETLSQLMTKHYYQTGQLVFREGEPGDAMYLIWSGRIVVFKGDFQEPIILTYRGPGELFGEMALLENRPRSASVVALEDLYLYRINLDVFDHLLAHDPAMGRSLLGTLSKQLRMADDIRRNCFRTATQLSWQVAELQTQKEQLLELQEALYHTGHAISGTIDLNQILDLILEYIAKLVPYDRAAVLIQNGPQLDIVAAKGFPAELSPFNLQILLRDDDIFHQIRRTQKPLAVPDVLGRPDFQQTDGLSPARSWLGVPLIRFNQVIGMLSLTRQKPHPFKAREVSLAATFTGQTAIALENARLYDRIARFTQQLEGILKEPTETVQAAYAQLEIFKLLGASAIPSDIFEALTTFLFYGNLSDLPAAIEVASELNPDQSPVYAAIQRLKAIGLEVATYQAATSKYQKLAALARAVDCLNDLSEYVTAKVTRQERIILEGIIHQWRRLVGEAGGEVGSSDKIRPISNPYIAGNPVSGDLFVGREDILRRLKELWSRTSHYPSVILYGHRRMGKTSILHNLHQIIKKQTVIVDFNMQRMGMVNSTNELLYNLALALFDTLSPEQRSSLGEPDEERFIDHNPYMTLDHFLKRFDRIRAGHSYIITIDEFEMIEHLIKQGYLEARLLAFWRGLIQTYSWYTMVFAGLHTLQEMTRDYWHPLFGSIKPILVSFLSHDAAWRLITQPTPDFELDFDTKAIERIITLTHGQPYLIQLIGHGLVSRFNRQVVEEGLHREHRFTLVDVEAIINSPDFYHEGNAYFSGIWRLAGEGVPGQQAILNALTIDPATTEELAELTNLSLDQTQAALRTLVRHDIVHPIDSDTDVAFAETADETDIETSQLWDFTVDLMRQWVAER